MLLEAKHFVGSRRTTEYVYYGENGLSDYALVQCASHEEERNVFQYSAPIDKIKLIMREKEQVRGGSWDATRTRLLRVTGRRRQIDLWVVLARDLFPQVHDMLKIHRHISQAHLLNKYMTGKDGANMSTDASRYKLGRPFCTKALDILIEQKKTNKRYSSDEFCTKVCIPMKQVRFVKIIVCLIFGFIIHISKPLKLQKLQESTKPHRPQQGGSETCQQQVGSSQAMSLMKRGSSQAAHLLNRGSSQATRLTNRAVPNAVGADFARNLPAGGFRNLSAARGP